MDSVAESINNNRSVDKAIHKLHETIMSQQTAINFIKTTLATQQKDITAVKTTIVDMQNSINHIIHSLSDLTTKLGFQITLPPPLPLSLTPPTSLPTTVAGSTTAASPTLATTNVSSLAISTPSPFTPSRALTYSLRSFHQTSVAHLVPISYTTFFSKTKVVATTVANEAPFGNNIDTSFSILTHSDNVVTVQFFSLSPVSKIQPTPYVFPFACFSDLYSNHRCLFVATVGNGQMIRIEEVYIFDPGGMCDAKRDSNLEDIVHSYISRSVADSYDNEVVAIFALTFTLHLYIKTVNAGSLFYATLNALSYFDMVCLWSGYTFIITLIPMHVLLCINIGRYSSPLYIAYAPLVVLGTLLVALVPVVWFNAVRTSEHFASFQAATRAYSAPPIVLTSRSHDGLHVFNGFHEAYSWLSYSTNVHDKIASWWDYGYQNTAMANRTVIADDNTWNNTYIETVGTTMSTTLRTRLISRGWQ